MADIDAYVQIADMQSYLRLTADDEIDSTQITVAALAASRAIEHHCKRIFKVAGSMEAATARYYSGKIRNLSSYGNNYGGLWGNAFGIQTIDFDDVSDLTGFRIDFDINRNGTFLYPVPSDGYDFIEYNAAVKYRPYTGVELHWNITTVPSWPRSVKVTARWGWAAVPPEVTQACLIQTSRFLLRRESPLGVIQSPAETTRLLSRLDPDVALLLSDVRRDWVAS